MPTLKPGEIHQPFTSNYDWCGTCKNWFRVLERKFGGWTFTEEPLAKQLVDVTLACGHKQQREWNPNMDGPLTNP